MYFYQKWTNRSLRYFNFCLFLSGAVTKIRFCWWKTSAAVTFTLKSFPHWIDINIYFIMLDKSWSDRAFTFVNMDQISSLTLCVCVCVNSCFPVLTSKSLDPACMYLSMKSRMVSQRAAKVGRDSRGERCCRKTWRNKRCLILKLQQLKERHFHPDSLRAKVDAVSLCSDLKPPKFSVQWRCNVVVVCCSEPLTGVYRLSFWSPPFLRYLPG